MGRGSRGLGGPAAAPRSISDGLSLLVLLDTSVLIDFMRGRGAVHRVAGLRDLRDRPCTTAINVEELVRGLKPAETEAARRMLAGLTLMPVEPRHGWMAGEWRRDYAARGTTLPQADCLVAAVAVDHGARLATGNPRHFPMSGLVVEDWPPGQ